MDGGKGKRSQDINRGDFNARSGDEGRKVEGRGASIGGPRIGR